MSGLSFCRRLTGDAVRQMLVLGLIFLAAFDLSSQHRSVRFQHLTTENGLPQNMVDCMLQDSQGFLWFGTWNGLCRYNGYNFEVFNNDFRNANSLKNNFIYSLHEDLYGNIWVGTAEGLYAYRYNDGQFVSAIDSEVSGSDYLTGAIRVITPFEEDKMLVGTSKGLYLTQVVNKNAELQVLNFFPFGMHRGEIPGSTITTILKDRQDKIWIGTDEGIVVLQKNLLPIARYRNESTITSISSDAILDIYQTRSGDVWVATEIGLNLFDPLTEQFSRYFNDPTNSRSLLHNTTMDLLEDQSGSLLVATLGGLSVLENGANTFTNYVNEANSEHSISNDFINCLLRDKDNNIWIGTERGGVNFYNSNQNTIEHFEYNIGAKNGLNTSTINSIYEDENHIWIGTAGGGLNRYNKRSRQFTHFRFDPQSARSLSSDFVTSIFRDHQGNLWVGTWGAGLNLLMNEGTSQAYFKRYSGPGEVPGLVSGFISSIVQGKDRLIWFGTLGGLVAYHPSKDQFETVFNGGGDLRINGVGCLLIDADENLWVGTQTGLFHVRIYRQEGRVSYEASEFNYDSGNPNSLSGNYVISMLKDAAGNVWFGTYGQGINKLVEADGHAQFESFDTSDGLSNNIVYGIEEDSNGNLWLSTDYGLSRFNPSSGKVRNFYISDGFQNNQYYWSASYKNKDGKLYFGGMNGLDSFYPDWIKEIDLNPEVVITDIKLLNESVRPGKEYNGMVVLDKSISKSTSINLSYKEKVFAVEFSSFNYQEPGLIRYAYILEGFESEWNYVSSNRRFANYTNLKPGTYTFKVKASGSNGEFLASPTQLTITILPPFWDTLWFKVLVLFVFVGMIFGYVRLRTYSLKRQKMMLERQVKDRTERINQQKEAMSFQAIQLQTSNRELEQKQKLIAGQNQKLETQNKEILDQRDKLMGLNKQLKLVSKLKLSFFTNISHEFRTPLTLIISPLEKLLKDQSLGLEAKNTLETINRNAQRLLHLINQIMDFRKIEKGRMELHVSKGNLSGFCRNVYDAFRPLSDLKKIDFSYVEEDLPREVWFDLQKVENILYNLLSNAFKYTMEGGKVTLEVMGLSLDESRLSVKEALDEEDKTIISIRIIDSGIGISRENLPLVFKRFYRIESEEAFKINGSGIGLALTEELIKTHHGEIFVDSEPGKGSVFEIQFPCLRASYGTDEITTNTNEGLNIFQQVEVLKNEFIEDENSEEVEEVYHFEENRPTILVVEDNADLRKFITHRLNDSYNILEASNGEVGLELAEKSNPEIVISDVMMPKKDGLELCATLKNNLATSHIPVILLTAKSDVEDQIEGLGIGADDYLPKPFNFELLEARVENLIEARRRLRKQFLKSAEFKSVDEISSLKDQKFIYHAIQQVEAHFADSTFGAAEFTKGMGISRSLLHKKLTSLTGQSATEFINRLRLKHAMMLLQQNELNISEIAYAVGYNDPKYFSRIFSKQFGKSPSEYLKQEIELS